MEKPLKMLDRSLYVLDRRSQAERRANWVRVTNWSSVYPKHLSISKYLT